MAGKVMGRALEAPLDATPKLVLAALSDQANLEGDGCFPSVRWIASRVRVDERTVQRHLKALEDGSYGHPYIEILRRPGRANSYRLLWWTWPQLEDVPFDNPRHDVGGDNLPGGVEQEGNPDTRVGGDKSPGATTEAPGGDTGVTPGCQGGVTPGCHPTREDPTDPKEDPESARARDPLPAGAVPLDSDAGHIARAPDGTPLVMPCSDGGETWGMPVSHGELEVWAHNQGLTEAQAAEALDTLRRVLLSDPDQQRHSSGVRKHCIWHLTRERTMRANRRGSGRGAPQRSAPPPAAQAPPPGEDDTTYDPASDEPDDPQPPREAAAG